MNRISTACFGAAALAACLAAACAAGVMVHFAGAGAELDERAHTALASLGGLVEDRRRASVVVTGFPDGPGAADGEALALRRARAVKFALAGSYGWPVSRITVLTAADGEGAGGTRGRAEIEVTADAPDARVEWSRGLVEYLPDGGAGWRPAPAGTVLYGRYKVRAGADGSARLRFADGGAADVRPGAVVTIYEAEGGGGRLEAGYTLEPEGAALPAAAAPSSPRPRTPQKPRGPGSPEAFNAEILGPAVNGARVRLSWLCGGPLHSLEVAPDREFTVLEAGLSRLDRPLAELDLPYGDYWARVRCLEPDGPPGEPSVFAFNVSGRIFRSLAPPPGSLTTRAEKLALSGSVVGGARVHAGESEAEVVLGSFSYSAPLSLGENVITLTGVTARGARESVVYRVQRQPRRPAARLALRLGGAAAAASGRLGALAPVSGLRLAAGRRWDLSLLGQVEDWEVKVKGGTPARGGGWAALGGARYLPLGRMRGGPYLELSGGYRAAADEAARIRRAACGALELGWRFPLAGGAALGAGISGLADGKGFLSAGLALELPLSVYYEEK